MGSTWLSRTALGGIAVCLVLAWLPRNAHSAEAKVPEDPTLLIDASYQDSREGDPAFWYSIRYHGQEVVSSDENQTKQDDGAGAPESPAGTSGDGKALVAGQPSGEADTGGASGQSERSFPALRLDYDWSSESDGPDLLRLHFGDQDLSQKLGLPRLLREWTGAVEVNATHNLGAVNVNVGLERPFNGLLDPGDHWAHYLLVGADLERVSPEDGNSTTHGNVTLEGWWSRGWGWHPERELDPAKVRKDAVAAVAAVARDGKTSMDQVGTGIGLAGKVIEAAINTLGYERADISGAKSGYKATLESALLKDRKDFTDEDWSNLDTALGEIQGLDWKGELRDKLTNQATRMADIEQPDKADRRSARQRPTFWDLLAVTVPEVGGIYEDVIQCVHAKECDKPWRDLADAFRDALGDFIARFSIHDGKVEPGSLSLLAADDESPVKTGDDLVNVLVKQTTRYEVRSVPALVFSLDAVGWAPVGGDEGYTFRGSVEPRLLWPFGPTAKTGISARYAYGYERSTRTKKINEWFVGLTYAIM